MPNNLKYVFASLLQRRWMSKTHREEAYTFFRYITPEYILHLLHNTDSQKFVVDPGVEVAYFAEKYMPKVLGILGISSVLMLDAYPILGTNKNPESTLFNVFPSYMYNRGGFEAEVDNPYTIYKFDHEGNIINVDYTIDYDIIMLLFPKHQIAKTIPFQTNVPLSKLGFGDGTYTNMASGSRYNVDSMSLTNFNSNKCSRSHAIAGVMCEGKRYVYNGWMRTTQDQAIDDATGGISHKYPCELMEYDWLQHEYDFCLNKKVCQLDEGNDDTKTCFNFKKGKRTYLLVNQKYYNGKSPIKRVLNPDPDVLVMKHDSATKRCIRESVSPKQEHVVPIDVKGKILNVATGRYVLKTGKIGRKLLSEQSKSAVKPKPNMCPKGKILNPATKRCVDENGNIGTNVATRKSR
jgi:hypothetical protein